MLSLFRPPLAAFLFLLPVTAFAHVAQHSLFIKSEGSLWAMGLNSYGQLGAGDTTNRNVPTEIVSSGVVAATGGSEHSLFVKSDGSLWAMGRNNHGQLGTGDTADHNASIQILSSGVVAVAAGANHSLFLKSDGSLWGMGQNDYGQLGNGSADYNAHPTPTQIVSSGVAAIARGGHHSLFIKTDGSLWAMGWNRDGQLGTGDITDRHAPTQVVPSGVISVTAGNWHTLFLKTDGSLWAMGENNDGQLGSGDSTDHNASIEVVSSGVLSVAASGGHSLFLKTDGTVWAMGENDYGQLGIGSADANPHSTPTKISSISKVVAIAANEYHSLFLKSNGNLQATGRNNFGQLGAEDDTDRSYPASVLYSEVYRLSETPFQRVSQVVAPDAATEDYFGHSISQSGNVLVVGAYKADPDGKSNAGSAYLYRVETNGSATYLDKLTAPDATASDYFGESISLSGDLLAIGAYGSQTGAAYLYRMEANGSATYLDKVTAPNGAAGDDFGESLSLSGNLLAVGASRTDPDGKYNAGAAYLFRVETNGTATHLDKVTAPDATASDYFGESISLSGNRLAVGAYSHGLGGAAFLFRVETNGTATYLDKVVAPDVASSDYFGGAISQSGDLLAVGAYGADPEGKEGAGAVYLYQVEVNGTATYLTKVTAADAGDSYYASDDSFGFSISQSGNMLAVGALGADSINEDAGAAYLYRVETNGSATYLEKITTPDLAPYDEFGYSVSLSGDVLAVGAILADPNGKSKAGVAHVFKNPSWKSQQAPVFDNPAASFTTPEGGAASFLTTATDHDSNAILAYSLSGADGNLFNLNAATGELTFKQTPDFENPADDGANNAYEVTIMASNGEGNATQAFTIGVTNVDDAATTGSVTITGAVTEDQTLAAANTLSDVDGLGAITYQWYRDGVPIMYGGVLKHGEDGGGGLDDANRVALSSDGRHAYVTGDDSLSWFERNATTGALTYGATLNDGVDGVDGLDGAWDVTVSADAAYAYVAGYVDESASWFSRNANTGALTYEGSVVGVSANLRDTNSVTLSPDGQHAYLTSKFPEWGGEVAWFDRNASSGALAYGGRLSETDTLVTGLWAPTDVTVSADGAHVYVTASQSNSVSWFERNATTGALTYGGTLSDDEGGVNGLDGANNVTLSPDGAHAYVTASSDDSVSWFNRDASTGALSYGGSLYDGWGGVDGLDYANDVTLSPDGLQAYVTARYDNSVSWFNRDAGTGALTYLGSLENGVNGVDGLDGAWDVTVSADGLHAYVVAYNDKSVSWFTRDATSGALAQGPAVNASYKITQADLGSIFTVTATFTDGAGATGSVTSNAIAPETPNQAPVFAGGSTFTTAENDASASFALTATDPDGDALTYSISDGADQAKFDLNASTGQLSFKQTPDFENPTDSDGNNVYLVEVTASDGSLHDLQAVTITVTDVNVQGVYAGDVPVIEWDGYYSYSAGSLVIHNGETYIALQDVPDNLEPGTDEDYWRNLAEAANNQSDPGDPPSVEIDPNETAGLADPGDPDSNQAPAFASANATFTTSKWNGLSDWFQSDWFGSFHDTGNDWVYHADHGWLYLVSDSENDLWFYDTDLGWVWTQESVYPFLYAHTAGNWIYYALGTSNPRWFYHFTSGQWQEGGAGGSGGEPPTVWSLITTYSPGELVIHNSITYMAQQASTNVTPGTDNAYWKSLDDLSEEQVDPGSPPDEAPDLSEVGELDYLEEPGTPDSLAGSSPVWSVSGAFQTSNGDLGVLLSTPENTVAKFLMEATDPDGDSLAYSLSGPDQAKFSINATTGELAFKQAPDFENPTDSDGNNVYIVHVTVSDGEWDPAGIGVGVTVTDDDTEDDDGDGYSESEEEGAGTDPNDSKSKPHPAPDSLVGQTIEFDGTEFEEGEEEHFKVLLSLEADGAAWEGHRGRAMWRYSWSYRKESVSEGVITLGDPLYPQGEQFEVSLHFTEADTGRFTTREVDSANGSMDTEEDGSGTFAFKQETLAVDPNWEFVDAFTATTLDEDAWVLDSEDDLQQVVQADNRMNFVLDHNASENWVDAVSTRILPLDEDWTVQAKAFVNPDFVEQANGNSVWFDATLTVESNRDVDGAARIKLSQSGVNADLIPDWDNWNQTISSDFTEAGAHQAYLRVRHVASQGTLYFEHDVDGPENGWNWQVDMVVAPPASVVQDLSSINPFLGVTTIDFHAGMFRSESSWGFQYPSPIITTLLNSAISPSSLVSDLSGDDSNLQPFLLNWTVPTTLAAAIDPSMMNYGNPMAATTTLGFVGDSFLPEPTDHVVLYLGGSVYGASAKVGDLGFEEIIVAKGSLGTDEGLYPNADPTGLNLSLATADQKLWENAPVGAHLGNLAATDPDGDVLSYSLVGTGSSSRDNHLLEIKGDKLYLKGVFDYETQAPYALFRIRVEDGQGGSMEKDFSEPIQNTYVGIVRTMGTTAVGARDALAEGNVLADGWNEVTETGFLVSQSFSFKLDDPGATRFPSSHRALGSFQVKLDGLKPGARYYCRAYMVNAEGVSYGARKRFTTTLDADNPWKGATALGKGWFDVSWLGTVYQTDNRWFYHQDLGWFHATADGSSDQGVWLWNPDTGWLWTAPQAYPFLWEHDTGNWLYFLARKGDKRTFFSYHLQAWVVR